jgi:hypothetical protein
MILFVHSLYPGESIEVDTPNFAFTVRQPGEYVFAVNPDSSEAIVRSGEGEAATGDDSAPVYPGQWVIRGSEATSWDVRPAYPRTDFERSALDRDAAGRNSEALRYVPAGTVGYQALDGNGRWENSPVYGSIWFPNVHPGWAPYHEGHWAWIQPWGWTWVDDAPWGFAPFHYGRWVSAYGRWGWVPGPRESRPVYAPALVAWVGGVSLSVGGGGGAVAWVPLGWHDPFIPAYHVSPGYAREVNISNSRVVNVTVVNNYYNTTNVNVRNTAINNIRYENTTVNGAVTGASSAAIASGRPMKQEGVSMSAAQVSHINVMQSATVVPNHEAVLGGHTAVAAPKGFTPPKAMVARTAPPPPPVKFESQVGALQKSGGMPLTPQAQAGIRAASPVQPQRTVVVAPKAAAPAAQHPAPAATPAPAQQHPAPAATPTPIQPHPAPAATPAPAQQHPAPGYNQKPAFNEPPAQHPAPVATPTPAQPHPAPVAQPHPAPAPAPAAQPHAPAPAPAPAAQPHNAPSNNGGQTKPANEKDRKPNAKDEKDKEKK